MRSIAALAFTICVLMTGRAVAARVVSLTPQMTELMFQLGKGDALVGVSQGSDYPDLAKTIPRVGNSFVPGIEALFRFSPDWILTDSQVVSSTVGTGLLASREFRANIVSVDSLFSESRRLLQTIFHDDANAGLAAIHAFKTILAKPEKKFKFLLLAWFSPVVLFGHTTFLSDLIAKLGGDNLIPQHWKQNYPQVSEEWMLRNRPDVVYFLADKFQSVSLVEGPVKRWWPENTPRIIALPADKFGRATLTPFFHLSELRYD